MALEKLTKANIVATALFGRARRIDIGRADFLVETRIVDEGGNPDFDGVSGPLAFAEAGEPSVIRCRGRRRSTARRRRPVL